MMKKIVRYGWKTIAWILGLITIIWIVLWIYVRMNEVSLIEKVSAAISVRTRGEAKIGGLSVSFFRTFPILSLQLTDVTLRDSLYAIHKQDFFSAADVYLKLSVPGLITGNSPLGKVIISNGSINIITDSTGYTNEYLLRSDKKPSDNQKKSALPDVVLKNVLVNYVNPMRFKLHRARISDMKCSFKEKDGKLSISINTAMQVQSLAFNTQKGSFLKDKIVEGDFTLLMDKEKNDLILNNIRLDLDGHPFYFGGKFHMDKVNPDFNLSIHTKDISFSKVTSFLNDSIRSKLKLYSFNEPVGFEVALSGKTLYKYIPEVTVNMTVRNNKLNTPQGMFEDCNFDLHFNNNRIPGEPMLDENSALEIKNFSGRWEKILIRSRSIKVSNLKVPFLECDLRSDVDMQSLNALAGSTTLQFLKGKTFINILFKGPVSGRDSVVANINGEVKIQNAEIKYLPRDFVLSDCNGLLRFSNNDLIVSKLEAVTGKTKLQMKGDAKNFLSLLNISPEKLVMHWQVYSPHLQLNDFKAFLSKSEAVKIENKKAQFSATASRVDKMFSDGDVYVRLETPEMEYKNFSATSVKANVIMKASEIDLQNVSLNHANGSMDISGVMKNGIKSNPVALHTKMRGMDIPLLFDAFDDFGQDAVTRKNLKGKLSADVEFSSAITNAAELITEQSTGSISFLLENGELNDFEPLKEIAKKAFKKQDFSQIRFADLKNKLDVTGTTFIVNPMEIRSTAITLFVEGIYDFKKGTDMSITLPLRNLTKSQANTDLSDEGKSKKGISLKLRARTGEDGKLKVSWDPFGKSVKNKEDIKDSAEVKK